MRIRIVDNDKCEACVNRTCEFVDSRMKEQFYSIRTEATICPVGVLMDETRAASFGDRCVNCALCVNSCYDHNLEIVGYSMDLDFDNLSELQYNAIALSYLDRIVGFAANTNRTRALAFDGFLQTFSGESCFVEVDYKNDSLECCRRLLGAFITYEGGLGPIRNGLIVLREFPREGSRDVYSVINKLSVFPTTTDCSFYFCTFSVLRHLMLFHDTERKSLSELFFNPRHEHLSEYLQRLRIEHPVERSDVDQQIAHYLVVESTNTVSSEYRPGLIPLYSIRVACGRFEGTEVPEVEGWVDASGHGFTPDMDKHFAVHAKGDSMSPLIKNGDICVFEKYFGGSREGEIVLTESCFDSEYDGSYTIKKYHSIKTVSENEWEHNRIVLLSINPDYSPIELSATESEYRTIGVFRAVL